MSQAREWSARMGICIDVTFDEVDVQIGGDDHDLMNPQNQEWWESRLDSYDLVTIAPPCNTWSRLLFRDRKGPRPLRDFRHPWGFP